ncbi:hypothetical protein NC651_018256 [Populus alba x Populus x berolinensis]|nr:hypothetical protein NC651_018256 [Populus alba x Populus x berolinensis]
MGGEIKVVKKNGPGTLMRLYLLLKTPADGADLHCQVDFSSHNAVEAGQNSSLSCLFWPSFVANQLLLLDFISKLLVLQPKLRYHHYWLNY